MVDLSTLTDAQLDEQRVAILTEQERRQRLDAAPDQAVNLARQYKVDGGDPQVLADEIHTVAAEHETAMMAAARQEVENA